MTRKLVAATAVVLGVLVSGCTQATRISSLTVPEATYVQAAPIEVGPYAEKYAGFDGVMLDVDETIEHSGVKEQGLFHGLTDEWTYSRVYRERYLILNPEAQWLTTYELPYKPDKFYVLVTSPAGQVSHYSVTDMKDYKDDFGRKRYKMAFPRVEKGTVVEIGYEDAWGISRFMPPLDQDITLQYAIPCEHIKFTFAYPEWWMMAMKDIGPGKAVPIAQQDKPEARKKLLVFEKNDVPALKPEAFRPYFKQLATYFQFQVVGLEMMGITYDAPSSWSTLAERYRKYAIKKNEKKSDDVDRLVDSLTQGLTAPEDKMKRIANWVSNNIEPTWESNKADPGKTLQLKKGTTADITGMVGSMLYSAGIESLFLLVHDASDGYFDENYVSGDQLYTPALQVKLNGREYVLFPWIKRLPATLIPESFRGETAMIVSEIDAGRFITVPDGDPTDNTLQDSLEVTVDTVGAVHVKELRTFNGVTAYNLRRLLDGLDVKVRDDSVKAIAEFAGADLTMRSYQFVNDTAYDRPLQLSMEYDLSNLVVLTPDEVILQAEGLLAPTPYGHAKVDTLNRLSPVCILFPEEYRKHVTLHFPERWSLVTSVENAQFENSFGSITSAVNSTAGQLDVSQEATLVRTTQPREKIVDLAALIGTGSRIALPALVFKTGALPPAGKP